MECTQYLSFITTDRIKQRSKAGNPAAEGTGYFFTQNCKFQLLYSFMVEEVCKVG